MKQRNDTSSLGAILKLLYFLLPILLVIVGTYFFYYKFAIERKVVKTKDDIIYITQNIKKGLDGRKYKDFDSNFMVFSNYLPFDLIPKQTAYGYKIPNRFGGLMIFYESVGTIQERGMYLNLRKTPKRYKEVYGGVSTYIVMLTQLKKEYCSLLAQTDWRKIANNFLGMEAAYVTPTSLYNGLYNLQMYVLIDNPDEKHKTKDLGVISRSPLSKQEADRACQCNGRNCSFAIKFL